ncbi:hypothetical protein GW17_00053711 [Ensete ventricosum]|nr:hypothetical protein GW17_00053711 [Ensete ventricosum]RZR92090.1 hypothetical protein BHM03_00020339 [Ensete ventricosum]
MLPLRFPNSGIRAKERLAMAWLPTSGWPTVAKAPCKEAANYGQEQQLEGVRLQLCSRKGRQSPAARP